jgi:hypothetical protein
MAYNLKSFIRKVPRNDFKEYLTTKYPDIEFDDKYLSKDKNDKFEFGDRKYGEYITKLIKGLDGKQQLSINHDCELSYIITQDDFAIQALDNAIEEKQSLISEGLNLERQSAESKALILQINYPEIINLAVKYYSLDKYSNGTKQSQYNLSGGFEFKQDEETKRLFEEAINKSVNKKNIIQLKTKTDWIERTLANGEKVQQIILYHEKQPTAVQQFNEENTDELKIDFLLIVSEGAISFNPKTGAIYIAGEGGKDFHDSIKEDFQKIAVKQPEDKELEIKKIEPNNINYKVFNTKPNFEPHYNGYFKSVEVELIRLINGKVSYLINNKSDGNRDVYQNLKSFAKINDIEKTAYKISKVGICCVIQQNETDDEEIISFDLTYPNKSSLPNQHSVHQKPIEELLKTMSIL